MQFCSDTLTVPSGCPAPQGGWGSPQAALERREVGQGFRARNMCDFSFARNCWWILFPVVFLTSCEHTEFDRTIARCLTVLSNFISYKQNYSGDLNSLVALHELYKYINKYYDQVSVCFQQVWICLSPSTTQTKKMQKLTIKSSQTIPTLCLVSLACITHVMSLLYSYQRTREEISKKNLSVTWRLLGFHIRFFIFTPISK